MREGIYLRENDEYVGPFGSREDALRFLLLMAHSGESIEGIEIVDMNAASETGGPPSFPET